MSPTDIIAWVERPARADSWNWAEAATEAWLAMADSLGWPGEVVSYEVEDTNNDAAIVAVDGRRYVLTLRDDTVSAHPANA
ncbi:hypothetical protein [Microbispora sp. NPDC049633]|uniref:hypothetical protein n=1 Tax=Microbispora sp. NPDC049633 TaxID=3154355 RepID=UPI00341FAD4B